MTQWLAYRYYCVMGVMTTAQVAEQLGVSTEAVRKMLSSGRLVDAGKMGRMRLVDSDSVHRYQRSPRRVGRIWTQGTTWAALSILSGDPVDWLSTSELWRLRKSLANLEAQDISPLARRRAVARRYHAGESTQKLLSRSLALTGGSLLVDEAIASNFGLAAGSELLDGYARAGFVKERGKRLGLREDSRGNVIIREADFVEAFSDGRVPLAAVAVDLYDSGSSRERSAGLAKLEELLDAQRAR